MSAWAVGLATLEIVTIGEGLCRTTMTTLVAWLSIGASFAVGVATYRLVVRDAPPWSTLVSRRALPFVLAALFVVAALYACVLVSGWAKPELSFDGNTYHVPAIHFWAERGYVHWIVPDDAAGASWRWQVDALMNALPKGGELVGFVLVRAFDGSQPANLLSFAFLPLGVLGIVRLARSVGADRPFAIVAGLAWLLVPTNVGQSVTTYVDTAFASCVIAWLAAVIVALEQVVAREDLALTLPASASTIGLTLATKPTGLAVVALGLTILAGASLYVDRGDLRRAARRACVAAVAPLALGLVVGGYWYARNWAHTGNPVFPVRVAILGHTLVPGLPVDAAIAEEGNTPPDLARLPGALRVLATWSQRALAGGWPDSVRFYDAREGGLGFLWLLGGLPSIAILAVRRWRDRSAPASIALAALVVTCAAFFVATPMHWWARYTLWIQGAGLPALAAVATEMPSWARVSRAVAGAWLAVLGLVVARESFVAFRWATTARCFIGEPQPIRNASDFWRALTEDDGAWSFYHELRGHPLASRALTDGGTVAVASPAVLEAGIVGVAGTANGRPRVVLLDDAVLRDPVAGPAALARDHVAWVFYGEHLPPSAVLEGLAHRRESVDPLWVVYDLR